MAQVLTLILKSTGSLRMRELELLATIEPKTWINLLLGKEPGLQW